MKTNRKYLPAQLKIESWNSVETFYEKLNNWKIGSVNELKEWLAYRSELKSILSEDLGWRYIKMNCNTENDELSKHFEYFVSEIEPKISEWDFELNKKLKSCEFALGLEGKEYEILIRAVNNEIAIFRQENVPIQAEIQKEEQEYGRIAAAMTIQYQGEEITLQKASNFLKDANREIRKEAYQLIWKRRLKESKALDDLFLRLLAKRQRMAKNAGFENFRDYIFNKMGRFDYQVKDCYEFHESVLSEVVPLVDKIQKSRKEKLGLDVLKPWDLDVDENLKPAIRPFQSARELVEKTIHCFNKVKPEYARFINKMDKECYLDLDSRKGKAPGGFNYPLHESNIPFIFMNATGNQRDVETMVHEGGHAIHSFLSKDLELIQFKDTPSEIAELASMSMELISMEHWESFFENSADLKRAKLGQLLGTIQILPWVAMVDKFQHLLYLEPNLTPAGMAEKWRKVSGEYAGSIVDWSGLENILNHLWQKQLHIFEVPFYYIEYGFAQLGAIAIWRNYKLNPAKALDNYENALKLGYTRSIPEVYQKAGIQFNFSKNYIKELMSFVQAEIEKLDE